MLCPCPPHTTEHPGLCPCAGTVRGRGREPGEVHTKGGWALGDEPGGSDLQQAREAEAVGVLRKSEAINFFHFSLYILNARVTFRKTHTHTQMWEKD